MILKPAECILQRDGRILHCRKWICANRGELERAVAQWGEVAPLLMQPFIDGTGEGIFGLAGADGIRAWSAHRRLRMMNPQGSGSSACVSQPVPEDIRQPTEELIRRAGWRGLFMIELLRDRFGKPWFVEFNGRAWGSMALSRRQGLEYPAWHMRLAVDERSSAGSSSSYSPGIVCRHVARELLHLLFVFRGPRSQALTRWPSLWKAAGEVFRVRRSDTLYNWRRDDARVFFADCYHTIHANVFNQTGN
jgi:predicted ATP-grasp superfamily ATP-dependent carboligase